MRRGITLFRLARVSCIRCHPPKVFIGDPIEFDVVCACITSIVMDSRLRHAGMTDCGDMPSGVIARSTATRQSGVDAETVVANQDHTRLRRFARNDGSGEIASHAFAMTPFSLLHILSIQHPFAFDTLRAFIKPIDTGSRLPHMGMTDRSICK